MPNMNEAGKENDCQGRAIIFQKFSDISLEEATIAKFTTNPATHKDKESDHDAQIGGRLSNGSPLPGQDLDTFLEIDKGNVEPEDIT